MNQIHPIFRPNPHTSTEFVIASRFQHWLPQCTVHTKLHKTSLEEMRKVHHDRCLTLRRASIPWQTIRRSNYDTPFPSNEEWIKSFYNRALKLRIEKLGRPGRTAEQIRKGERRNAST